MKKLLTIFALMLVAFTANAQSCPDNKHPHLIDLGLPSGTKWACCNVDDDASKQTPTNYGSYYAWGETEEKDYYDWSTYIHCDGSRTTCHNLGSDISGTQYDVAHVKWGGSWVMPSTIQQQELINNCTYEWTTVDGVNGGKFTSKTNGGSIFLPAAGLRSNGLLYYAGSYGYYWSSTQHPLFSSSAYSLGFNSDRAYWEYPNLQYGLTVRPVCTSPVKLSNIRGDVNGDKAINITDVAMMTTHIMGDFNKDFLSANADLNNDGDINITDVVTAVNIILTGKGVSSIELPEGAEISASDLTIYSDGEQVDAGDNGLLGACVGDMMAFNGDSLVYLSYGSGNDDRTLNSLETAISLLLPIIPFAVTDMDDDTFWLLKFMIGHLEQTRELASAIDQSIIDKGYLDMDAINPQYLAAVAELQRRLGIDDGASLHSPRMKSRNTTNPYFLNAGKELQGGGVYLIKDHSIWGTGENGGCWKCDFTVLNEERWSYTSLVKVKKNNAGNFDRIDEGFTDTFTNLISPNNVSAFMDWGLLSDLATNPEDWLSTMKDLDWDSILEFKDLTTTLSGADLDRVANQFWEPLKNLGHVLRGEETESTTYDKVKKSGIQFELYPDNDHLRLLGPGDDAKLSTFNYVKICVLPFLRLFIKEIKKSDLYEDTDATDKLMIYFVDWMCKDFTFINTEVIAKISDTSLSASERFVSPLGKVLTKFFEFCWTEDITDNISELLFKFGLRKLSMWQPGYDDPQLKAILQTYKTILMSGDIVLYMLDSNFEGDVFKIDYGPSYGIYHQEQYEDYTVGDVTFRMVKLPGGPFMMGAEPGDEDATDNEKPLHYVNLNDFFIGETEVTQNLWMAVMCEDAYNNPSTFNNFTEDRPVNNVTWEECQEFITKLNELTHLHFRLPTEAEWEFAAAGGMYKRGYPYAGGSNANEVAWCGRTETHGVKELKANEFKLYDMSGNVAEWCQDYYDSKYYKNSPEDDPCNNTDGTAGARVYRGGGFKSEGKDCRVSARAGNIPSVRSDLIGLRLALDGTQLVLSTKHVYLAKGGECAVDILSGSGKYTVESKDEAVATAVIDDRAAKCKVRITAHSVEETTITVSDTETGQTVEIVVIVNPAQTFTVNGVSFRMVEVDGDTFWMGAADDDPEANSDERPIHLVALSNFSIGETEVTQALWNAVMGENPSNFDYLGGDNPVENVSWNDCQIFISKLKEKTGKNFRLPTEAEWEFAARAGKNNEVTKYAGSNDIDAVAWYVNNSQSYTHPVASKLANRWGLFDMTGNVWEWCQDSYAENYYSTSPSANPCNTAEANNRVARGGSWADSALGCRLVFRGNAPADRRDGDTGLRLVLDDGEVVMPLGLSTNTITLTMGQQETVDVTSGSGSYAAVSNATSVATVTVEGSKLIITAVSSGNATITVKDNQTQERAKIEVTVSDTPQAYLTCPDDHHPHMIDLGLPSGTKWACCNVDDDASKQTPTNYGSYYAWGETEEKNIYDWSTYTHCDGTKETCHDLGSDIAGTRYDVAHVRWGGSWVMPTHDQQMELLDNCTYEWTTVNGVKGGRFTSKNNGGSIFLPAAGDRNGSGLYDAGSGGYYWSSTQDPSYSSYAYCLAFASGTARWYDRIRGNGHSVRPVSR